MIFNTDLLKNIPPDDWELAKLILYAISQDMNLWKMVKPTQSVELHDELKDKANTIVTILLADKTLDVDYCGQYVTLSVIKDLYSESVTDIDEIVKEARSYFLKAYSGKAGWASNNQDVKRLLLQWQAQYKGDIKKVPEACKAYIDDCHNSDRFIKRMENFIMTETSSDLMSWIEDLDTKVVRKSMRM